jgi:hypothetical protein
MPTCQLLAILACVLSGEPSRLTLKGIIDDGSGQPVVGARVDIATAAPRVGTGLFCPSCYLDCQKKTRSNDKGEFEISGLNPSLKFHLVISMPGKKTQLTGLVDPLTDSIKISLADLPNDFPPERMLRGRAVNDQGLAIEGALVEPDGAQSGSKRWWGRVDGVDPTVTDSDGRFVMPLPQDYKGVDITVTADGYAGTSMALLAPGADEHRVVVPRGTRVTGRLACKDKLLAGVRVAVVQEERNAGHHFIKAVADVTNRDGQFVLDYLPANESYVSFSVVGEGPQEFVLTTKRFKATGDGEERDLGQFEAIPALRLAGRVELADGEALPQDTKIVLIRNPAWDLIEIPVREDGHFEISGLPPEAYELRIAARGYCIKPSIPYQLLSDQSFGLSLKESIETLRIPVQASSEPPKPSSAKQSPELGSNNKPTTDRTGFIGGRVLKDNQPRPNVIMKLFLSGSQRLLGKATTDEDGQYSIDGLKAGDQYYFEIIDSEHLIAPGWMHQMPYIHPVDNEGREILLPDVHLVRARQSLRGVVVSPEGIGVGSVRVSAQMANGEIIPLRTSGPKAWTTTKADGSFELQQLPEGLIELIAYRENPKGGRIVYPAKVRPELSQTDIRIVFDPSLQDGIVDLDAARGQAVSKR